MLGNGLSTSPSKPTQNHCYQLGVRDAVILAARLDAKEARCIEERAMKLAGIDLDVQRNSVITSVKAQECYGELMRLQNYVASVHASRSWRLMQLCLRLIGRK